MKLSHRKITLYRGQISKKGPYIQVTLDMRTNLMLKALVKKKKVSLLLKSWKRGIFPFGNQLKLIVLDSAIRKKHLVFKLDAQNLTKASTNTEQESLIHKMSWEEFPPYIRTQILEFDETIDWGDLSWFNNGWRMCVGELNNQVVSVGWLRDAQASSDFFVDMPIQSELLWHLTVVPDFQGRQLHAKFRLMLMQERADKGIQCFYTNCRDYNLPSYYNILKLGFQCIGYCTENRLTGGKRWHPL